MSRAAYVIPPAQTDGRNHNHRAKAGHVASAAHALLERESHWTFPAADFSAPLSGRYRGRSQKPARRS